MTKDTPLTRGARDKIDASKLWTALASVNDVFVVVDSDGEFIETSDAFATFHRFDANDPAARQFAAYPALLDVFSEIGDRVPPEQWPIARALRGETFANVDHVLQRRDTGEKWDVSYSFAPVRDDTGNVIGAIVTARDVTARKKSEAAARAARQEIEESNRLLALGEGLASMGTWHFDPANRQVEWSDGMYRIQGLPPGNGRPDLMTGVRIWHPEDRARHRDCMKTALATGIGYSFDGRMLRHDGTVREISEVAQCQVGDDGTVVGVFGIVQDITEIKDAQRRLLDANHRLVAATEAGRVGIWEMSCVDGAVATDAVTRQLCGLGGVADEPATEVWWSLLHPDDLPNFQRAIDLCTAGQNLAAEFRIICPDGSLRYLETRAGLICDAQGRPRNILGTLWDVTETHALNAQLVEEKQRAEQANLAKSRFLAMMSHEIRTPMSGIIGMNQLLRDSELTPRQRFYADTIHDSSTGLLRIMDSILDLSKLEAGKLTIDVGDFDLAELIEQSVIAFSSAAEAKGLALTAQLTLPKPARFQGDAALLRQVLLNLIANAVKFTESGAITVVATGSMLENAALALRVEVRDTGIGLTAEARSRLFNPFEQADNSISRRFGGTGLGLSISKHLIELMGGNIGVDANAPRGSIFWFDLVLAPPETLAPAAPSAGDPVAASGQSQGSGHILVVEDNRINATLVTAFLEAGGYTCDLASDGITAIDAVTAGKYDLVLMDVQMPVLDGLSATRRIRELPEGGTLPIVAMTANAMTEDRDQCLAAGMDDYISKPIDRMALYAVLQRWIGQAGRQLRD